MCVFFLLILIRITSHIFKKNKHYNFLYAFSVEDISFCLMCMENSKYLKDPIIKPILHIGVMGIWNSFVNLGYFLYNIE